MKMNMKSFREYLEKGECAKVDATAQDASLSVVIVRENDPFFSILARLCAVEMLAKDLHYRCCGKSFYGEHLLADLIHDMGEKADDLNEIRYMGELHANPPMRASVAKTAVSVIDSIDEACDECGLLRALFDQTNAIVDFVESAKATAPASGTTAVLDAISEKALQANGFLKRVIDGEKLTDVDMPFKKTAKREH